MLWFLSSINVISAIIVCLPSFRENMLCNLCTSMLLCIIWFKVMYYLSLIIHFLQMRNPTMNFKYEVLSDGSDDQWEFVIETSTSEALKDRMRLMLPRIAHTMLWRPAPSLHYPTLFSLTPTETAEENNVTHSVSLFLDSHQVRPMKQKKSKSLII